MLPAIEITINVLWIVFLCSVFAIAGFIFRRLQINKLRQQLRRLERQILLNDAELLSLQKEYIALQDKLKNGTVPVIPITTKEIPENLPDSGTRKKLLGKSASNQHS